MFAIAYTTVAFYTAVTVIAGSVIAVCVASGLSERNHPTPTPDTTDEHDYAEFWGEA